MITSFYNVESLTIPFIPRAPEAELHTAKVVADLGMAKISGEGLMTLASCRELQAGLI